MYFFVRANMIGRRSARNEHRVKIFGCYIGDELFRPNAGAFVQPALSPDLLASLLVDTDDRHDCACVLECPARLGKPRFFISIANECGDPFPFD